MTASESSAERFERWTMVAVAAIVVGWGLLSLTWPLSGDTGIFSWIADTVHRGGVPYRDAWDTKGPAAWLPSWLMQAVFGRSAWGIRVFDFAMLLAALLGIRACAIRLAVPGRGHVGVMLYALWYASLDYWQSAQPDGWVAAWLIVACALALRATTVSTLLAGSLVGLATMNKPFYLGFLVPMLMLVAFRPQLERRDRFVRSLLVVVGCGITIGAVLWLIRFWGGWHAYVDAQRWTRDVYAGLGGSWSTRFPAAYVFMLQTPSGVIVPFALFGLLYPSLADRRLVWAFGVAFAGALAGVILQGRFWQYHGLPLLPFLALLADLGFSALQRDGRHVSTLQFRRVALVLALVTGALAPLQQFYRFARSRRSAEAAETYERHEFSYYGRQRGSAYAIVDSLVSVNRSTPSVMVWGMHLGPQFVYRLPPTTRAAVIRPLFDGSGTAARAAFRQEFEQFIRDRPAQYWLLPTDSLMKAEPDLEKYDIATYASLDEFLRSNYHVSGSSGEWQILEVNASPPRAIRR